MKKLLVSTIALGFAVTIFAEQPAEINYAMLISDEGTPVALHKDLAAHAKKMMLEDQKVVTAFPADNLELLKNALALVHETKGNLPALEQKINEQFDFFSTTLLLQMADFFDIPELVAATGAVVAHKLTQPENMDLFAQQDPEFLAALEIVNSLPQASAIARTLFTKNQDAFGPALVSAIKNKKASLSTTLSPDGKRVATSYKDRFAKISDVVTGEPKVTIHHEGWIYNTAFSPDGTKILTASDDGTALVSHATTGKLICKVEHNGPVNNGVFSPDNKMILTASDDYTAKISDAATGKLLATVRHEGPVNSGSFSGDNKMIVTASDDGTAKISDATTGKLIAIIRHEGPVLTAFFAPNGRAVVSTSEDGTAKVSDVTTGQLIATIQHNGPVHQASFSPGGSVLFTASEDGTIKISDSSTYKPRMTLQLGAPVYAAAFSHDGKKLATAAKSNYAKIFNSATGDVMNSVRHDGSVRTVAFTPDDTMLVTTNKRSGVKIFLFAPSFDTSNLGEMLFVMMLHHLEQTQQPVALHDTLLSLWDSLTDAQKNYLRLRYPKLLPNLAFKKTKPANRRVARHERRKKTVSSLEK